MADVVKRSISLPEDLSNEIDRARGDIPLSRWLATAARLALHTANQAIDEAVAAGGVQGVRSQVATSAAARAGVKPRPKGSRR